MALVPLGVAMWTAHFALHLAIGANTAWPVLQRAAADLGVNWPGIFGQKSAALLPAHEWLPGLRLLLLDAGLLLSLYVSWRIARRPRLHFRSPFGAFFPWAALSIALFVAGFWISTQPMQMRGINVSAGSLQ
jgi:hypothetical protein